MIARSTALRILAPFGFFLALFVWISAKMAYSFTGEFPRLSLLCKWDCGWYESIARQGYLSPIPPLFQDSEHSNVAFFPAYPLLGRTVAAIFSIPFMDALPLASILCATGVSVALARLLREETRISKAARYAILFAYPATFYLFVSYSEALYLSAMLGGAALLLDGTKKPGRVGTVALGVAGLALGGTRLTGFVIPSFLFLGAGLFALRGRRFSALLTDSFLPRTATYLGGAVVGTAAFFAFCAYRFGVWNLYFWQLALGWYKEFSPAKALALLVNHPFGPSLEYDYLQKQSRSLSWMLITLIFGICVYTGPRAFLTGRRALQAGDRSLLLRCCLVGAAIAHFFIVVCGDVGPWDAWGNGLRYPMPTAYLLTIAWRDEWTPRFVRERPILKWTAVGALTVVLAWLFALQVGYLGRFIRNEWVS